MATPWLTVSTYPPDEHEVTERFVSLRDESNGRHAVTWAAIVATFNDEGIAPPSGEAWYPATGMRIYKREVAIQS
jgi:hypothetical protein